MSSVALFTFPTDAIFRVFEDYAAVRKLVTDFVTASKVATAARFRLSGVEAALAWLEAAL